MLLVWVLLSFFVSFASAENLSPQEFKSLMDSYLQEDQNVEKIGNALERFFVKKRQEQQMDAQKKEQEEMEAQFTNPVKIDIGQSIVKGPKDAPITIIEFSEFQCPFCKRGAKTVEEVFKEYPGKVKHVFKHFPLPFHPHATSASMASIAAGKQGKFWEMHDLLFDNQSDLGEETYLKLARELNLDIEKFKLDMKDPAAEKLIEEEKALGQKLGVRGTPGYFINGVRLNGAQPLPEFKKIIDRWLAKQGK
jgi:protein-disulfide isomerase